MFFATRKLATRSHHATSRTRNRAKFVATLEAVEDRLLMTGMSAISWNDGVQVHSEVFAIDFDNTVSMSKDGGAFVSEGGYAKSISAGLDIYGRPEVFAIDVNDGLSINDNGAGWSSRGNVGNVSGIAASSSGSCYVLTASGSVSTSLVWGWAATGLGGTTVSISAGTDSRGNPEVYALDSNKIVWSNDNGWGWSDRGGYLKAIAGSTNNTVFGIGFDNALYISRGGTDQWTCLGGTVKSITGGSDFHGAPEVYGIGSDNSAYSNDNGLGYRYIGGYVTELAGDANNRVYCRCMDVDYIESSQFNLTWNYVGMAPLANPVASAAYSPAPTTASLFNPLNNSQPSYLDMRQQNAADCWLDASLAEVALRDPQDIKGMFSYLGTTVDNGSVVGVYSVRFYGPTGNPFMVQVDTSLPSGGQYDNDINTAMGTTSLWTALAEKGYAEANTLGLVTTNHPDQGSYAALNNGSVVWALQAITGQPANAVSINPADAASAWTSGKLVVFCTTNATSTTSSIVQSHCYAMVGYNPSSSLPFEIFNPWGTQSNGYAPNNGPGTSSGNSYWGLFYANSRFVSTYFSSQGYGAGTTNPSLIAPATADDPTELAPSQNHAPGQVVKLGRFANSLIGSLRPTVGMSSVGGPLS